MNNNAYRPADGRDTLKEFSEPVEIRRTWEVSDEDYRSFPAMSFHMLKDFHQDPRAWRDGFFNREESDAMRFGTALHVKVLEGEEAYKNRIAVFKAPVNKATGYRYTPQAKVYKDAYSRFTIDNASKTIISSSDNETIDKLTSSLYFHPLAPSILGANGFRLTELAIKGHYNVLGEEFPVKGKIDCYSNMGLVEVKTVSSLDNGTGRDNFRCAIYDYKYIVQLGYYHKLLTDVCGVPFVPVWIVAFERNSPNRVAVYQLSRDVIENARRVVDNWLEEYVKARREDYYGSKYDRVQYIDLYVPDKDMAF